MSENITHTPSTKRLERSSADRVIAGVSGGLGRYFDLNPTFFRLGFVVLTLLGGAGILIYLAAVLVVPDEGKQSIAAETLSARRERPWPLVGLGLAAVALAVLLSRAAIWPAAGFGWVLVLLAGLVILWTSDARRGSRRSRIIVRSLVGVMIALIVAVVAAVSVAFAWFDVGLGDGAGTRVESPLPLLSSSPRTSSVSATCGSICRTSAPSRPRGRCKRRSAWASYGSSFPRRSPSQRVHGRRLARCTS